MLSPDCTVGKHVACSGDSWNFTRDESTACPCSCHTTGIRLITEVNVIEISLDTEPNAFGESATVIPATVTAVGRSHVAKHSFNIGREHLIVVHYRERIWTTHQRDESQ